MLYTKFFWVQDPISPQRTLGIVGLLLWVLFEKLEGWGSEGDEWLVQEPSDNQCWSQYEIQAFNITM